MKFQKLIQNYKARFPHGAFRLKPGESIDNAVRQHNVPDRYGVYFITSICGSEKKIIYIGKSGTLLQNGTFKKQTLKKRLTMKQSGEYRRYYFMRIINEMDLDCLNFSWFVTYTESIKILPGLAEAELIQAYWEDNKVLPLLNKQF